MPRWLIFNQQNNDMETYKPKIVKEKNGSFVYVEMLVEGKYCRTCGKVMIREGAAVMSGGSFPNYGKLSIKEQAKNAGLEFMSGVKVDNQEICITCKESGKADFLCRLCNARKSSDKVKETFGDPPEYLCEDCYETVPAKQWDEIVETLRDEHEYDFE